jgi:hypothetical protein
MTKLQYKITLRAGAIADFGNRQEVNSEITSPRNRKYGFSAFFDCLAGGGQTAQAVKAATEILGVAPPRRISTVSSPKWRPARLFAKRPELNRDSFRFADAPT